MQDKSQSSPSRPRWWVGLAVFGSIAALLAVLLMNAPRGFDTDLTKVGSGKPSLVFVYDPNLTVSNIQTTEINKIRDDLQQRLHLVLADVGRPDGQSFVQKHQADSGQLLLFSNEGTLLASQRGPIDAKLLNDWINLNIPGSAHKI